MHLSIRTAQLLPAVGSENEPFCSENWLASLIGCTGVGIEPGELAPAEPLLFLCRQTPCGMRIGARLPRAQFALLSWLGAASRATNGQGWFFLGFHSSIMQRRPGRNWSIVTSAFPSGSGILVG